MTERYELLRQMTEQMLGLQARTPKDFELLSRQIYARTGKMLSVSTLKRFWGYVNKEKTERIVRYSTLDILSEYIGYQNWALFCQTDVKASEESSTMANRHLFAKELSTGTHIELRWKPNRLVTVRYEGEELFTVVESINSKLHPADTFHCSHIVEGMPLTLFTLVREGAIIGNYVCGREHGVTFAIK